MSFKNRAPAVGMMMLDGAAMQDSVEEATSYQIHHTNALQLRAFLFHDGSIFSKDGKRELGIVTASDIDMESKRSVGKGSSGQVFVARLKGSNKPIALKNIMITTKPHRDEVERELTFFSSRSDSPFVMQNLGAFWESEENCIVLPMEWMPYNLKDVAEFWGNGGIDEPLLKAISYQVLRGMQYLHDAKRVIHRDIKPSNILVRDDGYVKIGDFGVSKLVQTLDVSTSYIGTMYYMAPERLEQGSYSFSSDVWSLGLSLISIVRGGGSPWAPPAEVNVFQLLQKISGNSIPVLSAGDGSAIFSEEARDFVSQCLERSPDARPSCRELLSHAFFDGMTESVAVETVRNVVELMTRMIKSSSGKASDEAKSAAEVAALRDAKMGRLDHL